MLTRGGSPMRTAAPATVAQLRNLRRETRTRLVMICHIRLLTGGEFPYQCHSRYKFAEVEILLHNAIQANFILRRNIAKLFRRRESRGRAARDFAGSVEIDLPLLAGGFPRLAFSGAEKQFQLFATLADGNPRQFYRELPLTPEHVLIFILIASLAALARLMRMSLSPSTRSC
jgi:hypothetical protein